MMETQTVSETLDHNSILTQLFAQEDFITPAAASTTTYYW
jgi:hypothetical protein